MGLKGRENVELLIAACQRGDRDALRTLYEAYKDRVYSIAVYYFHGDEAMAGDITQQVFLKLIIDIGQFRGESSFPTWLHRMTMNTCIDASRRRKPMEPIVETRPPRALIGEGAQQRALEETELTDAVKAAVQSLPEPFRLAILLRYFDDLSYEEMAQALACSMGTVASRLSRGHRLLAEKLMSLRGGVGE